MESGFSSKSLCSNLKTLIERAKECQTKSYHDNVIRHENFLDSSVSTSRKSIFLDNSSQQNLFTRLNQCKLGNLTLNLIASLAMKPEKT